MGSVGTSLRKLEIQNQTDRMMELDFHAGEWTAFEAYIIKLNQGLLE